MKTRFIFLLTCFLFLSQSEASANLITATPANYTSFVGGLVPGDTLSLVPGSYLNPLNLSNLNGTPAASIVIVGVGNSTVFLGNACCNTVEIRTHAAK